MTEKELNKRSIVYLTIVILGCVLMIVCLFMGINDLMWVSSLIVVIGMTGIVFLGYRLIRDRVKNGWKRISRNLQVTSIIDEKTIEISAGSHNDKKIIQKSLADYMIKDRSGPSANSVLLDMRKIIFVLLHHSNLPEK